MNILLLSGSMQADSQTLKVVTTLSQKLNKQYGTINTQVIDLHKNALPFDVEQIWTDGTPEKQAITDLREKLEWADGYVVATPEWSGMATPAIKNIFLHHGLKMAHKPGLLVTVSSGRGGAYPVAELRMSSYKNSRINYIPEHLIVRGVGEVLNTPEPDHNNESDMFYHKRADYALAVLVEYTKALEQVRASGVIDHESFENGM